MATEDSDEARCWICLGDETDLDNAGMIAPCACVGTNQWVHESCARAFPPCHFLFRAAAQHIAPFASCNLHQHVLFPVRVWPPLSPTHCLRPHGRTQASRAIACSIWQPMQLARRLSKSPAQSAAPNTRLRHPAGRRARLRPGARCCAGARQTTSCSCATRASSSWSRRSLAHRSWRGRG